MIDHDSRVPTATTTPRSVVALVESTTRVERELIGNWLAEGGITQEFGTEAPVTQIDLDPDAIATRLVDRRDDPLVVPVRVLWLPPERDGVRRTTFTDLVTMTNPRKPNRVMQRRLVDKAPDRHLVLTGQPARLSELRANNAGAVGAPEAFARAIVRAGTVALERAERAVIGDRYKVPRLVAEEILDSPEFLRRLGDIAEQIDTTPRDVHRRAEKALRELVAAQSRLVSDLFTQAMRPVHASTWKVDGDATGIDRLRALNRRYPLVFLPSHRSYVDAFVLGDVLARNDFPPNHVIGGANLSFWPMGPIARRTGTVFIRRSFGDDEVYKAVVEEYFAYLLAKRFNLEWYFEGGRSRTGKLRPPKYGLLNYLAAALRSSRVDDVLLVPVSITYERLNEIGAIADEQTGGKKKAEGLAWLARYVRNQQHSAGHVYVRFGEAISARERLTVHGDPLVSPPGSAAHGGRGTGPAHESGSGATDSASKALGRSDGAASGAGNTGPDVTADASRKVSGDADMVQITDHAVAERESVVAEQERRAVQRLAFDIAVGINAVTPITVNALTTLVLLGVHERALTRDELRAAIIPVLGYVERQELPRGELDTLRDDHGLAVVLEQLAIAKVVTVYRGGLQPVYSIGAGAHLEAAFYRNSAVHWFVNRAILELAILTAVEAPEGDQLRVGWEAAYRLRDLLKFEFFFPERTEFTTQLTAEMLLVDPEWHRRTAAGTVGAEILAQLAGSGFMMAHRVLRSFFDAQLVVAERLEAHNPTAEIDQKTFIDDCLNVGRQMLLQQRLHSPESVSSELFTSALKLADNHGLLRPDPDDPAELAARRTRFAGELRAIGSRISRAATLDPSNRLETL
ncbi:glycerol-3-phosphate 1-O-acyltransferase [Nocardia uniformis]|uniref:Glycerol-3-phosphate 1-O-acyltransferase n=1 Tax=Nocardia uniformis TaxID=53432 RepID=A0A849BYR6_9NOCA|nr:glycerol-3-phosphate 1-O-acyltransferase [Nocardia uniformis]NNH71652.1 glycerol-3-phosphate 1-O-acyltransferase [Nocardia uniformis]